MNRPQSIALGVAAVNLAVILLFPPFDEYVVGNLNVPIFGGFRWLLAGGARTVVNQSLLYLEVIVVLVNGAIAWLLLRDKPATPTRRRFSYQYAVLIGIAVNLVLIVLFPPFENAYAVTGAALPSFEGFYFVFARNPHHTIVATILYLEGALVLVNGALLWLLLKEKSVAERDAEAAFKAAMELRSRAARDGGGRAR